MKSLKIFLVILIFSAQAYSQQPIDTVWYGEIDIMGSKLDISTRFWSEGGLHKGTIDIPQQKQKDLPLSGVTFTNPKIYFELASPQGTAVFDGLYYGDSIGGTFKQAGVGGRFSLTLTPRLSEIPVVVDPGSLPYNSEEVSFTNDGNVFAGTLTVPKENTSGVPGFPAVILISGSGPQDRDEEIVGFKIFGVIADHLSRNGITVLRYDDRGVGGTTGKTVGESTTMDFAGDVAAAVDFLKSRGDMHTIGLLGHSEGGVVAPITANMSNDVSFVILMAGTGVKGIDIIREQSKLIMKADKSTDEEIEGYTKLLDAVYDAVKSNKPLDDVKQQIKQSIIDNFDDLPKEQKKNITNPTQYANDVAEMTIAQFNSPWMRYFLSYDPAPALEKLKQPALLLFGAKDLQVPPKQSEKPMVDALKKAGNQEYEVIIYPTGNHLFQDAVTGSPTEYATLKKEFVYGFLDKITEWIKVKAQ